LWQKSRALKKKTYFPLPFLPLCFLSGQPHPVSRLKVLKSVESHLASSVAVCEGEADGEMQGRENKKELVVDSKVWNLTFI
jgi:hypothetical protein